MVFRDGNGRFQAANQSGNVTAEGNASVWDRRPKHRRRGADAFDGRTRRARRFKELVADFEAGFGSATGPRENALIRQAAAVAVEAEGIQARILRGEPVDTDVLVRVTNVLARSLQALGIKSGKATKQPMTLKDYVASKQAETAR